MISPRLVILELSATGHRMEYVRVAVERISPTGEGVLLVTTADAPASPSYRRELAHLRGLTTRLVRTRKTELAQRISAWHYVLRIARKFEARIVVLDADRYLMLSAFRLRKSPPMGMLVMRPPNPDETSATARVKRLLIKASRWNGTDIRALTSPFSLDHRDEFGLPDPSGLLTHPLDEVDGRFATTVEDWKSRTSDHIKVGVFGGLDSRKSILELIQAVADKPWVALAVVGRANDPNYTASIQAALANHGTPPSHLLHLKEVSNAELELLLESVDVLALLYRNSEGSSGFLAHAIRHQKAVVSYRNATISGVIRRGYDGVVVEDLEADTLVAALSALRRMRPLASSTHGDLLSTCVRAWTTFVTGVKTP